ncbi:MAG: hypothetical protein ACRD8K_05600 [Nitrososphaeraceae archaeon]
MEDSREFERNSPTKNIIYHYNSNTAYCGTVGEDLGNLIMWTNLGGYLNEKKTHFLNIMSVSVSSLKEELAL